MTEKKDVFNSAENGNVSREIIKYIYSLLCDSKLAEKDGAERLGPNLLEDPEFVKLCSIAMDIRKLTAALNKGELQEFVKGKGYVLSNLKGLQANLRHLTWQTKKIAEGDFTPRVDFLGDFSESFNIMTDKLKNLTNDLVRLANYDYLTKLPNRMALTNFLATVYENALKEGRSFSTLIIDIDFFKKVNDTYGHDAGDEVLVQLSDILNSKFRSTDFWGRYGGEEFLVVLPGTDVTTAQRRAQDLLLFIEQSEFKLNDKNSIQLTVSIGVSELKQGDDSYDSVIKRSDKALYQAKTDGRNRVCVL